MYCYFLVYVVTIVGMSGVQTKTESDFFYLKAPAWTPEALEEAKAAILAAMPASERAKPMHIAITFVKESSV
jgi:hypothetical protein